MRIAIIGCTHAGIAAAKAIFAKHPESEVVIYERNNNVSFLSCGIALYTDNTVSSLEKMFYETPQTLEELGATVRVEHDVIEINTRKKTLRVQNLKTDEIIDDYYDKLIYTAGSQVIVPPLSGIDSSRVLMCKNYEQAKEIKRQATTAQHIAIVGGGYVGIEMAESYAKLGREVSLFQGNEQLLNSYIDRDFSCIIQDELKRIGVKVHINERVREFTASADGEHINIVTENDEHQADIAIACTGFRPNTALLSGCVEMTPRGALITNQWMQTSDPDIYAAGDACTQHDNVTGQQVYKPLATSAIRQGRVAGLNVFGEVDPDSGTQSSTALRLSNMTLATTGATAKEARKYYSDVRCTRFAGPIRPVFMPGETTVKIKLVYDGKTRRVLGAQFLGNLDLTQSANAVSLLIQMGGTLETLAWTDMLFNPNYNEPYNYLNQVAQQALAELEGTNQ